MSQRNRDFKARRRFRRLLLKPVQELVQRQVFTRCEAAACQYLTKAVLERRIDSAVTVALRPVRRVRGQQVKQETT